MRLILLATYIICFFVPIHAQKKNVYSGISSDKNPMLRHHEAFFNAFMEFIKCKNIDNRVAVANEINGEKNSYETVVQHPLAYDSCNLEILSDVITNSGEEIVTISVDNGGSLKYTGTIHHVETNSKVINEEILVIEYSDCKSSRAGYEYIYKSVILLDDSTKQKAEPQNIFKVSIIEERNVSE